MDITIIELGEGCGRPDCESCLLARVIRKGRPKTMEEVIARTAELDALELSTSEGQEIRAGIQLALLQTAVTLLNARTRARREAAKTDAAKLN